MRMGHRLQGKAAVVTGAGRGIGRAVARLLAAEGARVVVNDLGSDVNGRGKDPGPADEVVAEIRAAGGTAVASHDDVASWAGAERIVETAVREFGSVDVLVNNAGILRDRMLFNTSEEEWDAVIAVNLKGTFNCTRHASAHMRQQRGGRIISMTSTSGLYGNSGQANYGAANDGVAGMTRVVARELGKYGVTVNAVAPVAATRLTATVPQAARVARAARGISAPGAQVALDADAVAPFVVYLATDAAAGINGQTFLVTDGVVSLLSYPAPARTIQKTGRWDPEEIATLFPATLGLDLTNPAPASAPLTSRRATGE
jgi:NAD(P)-dependent dehydrogenase (short-subunit alcohol dehydrogenase family)